MTGIDKLVNMLDSGKALTTKQIRARTGLADPSTAVRDLRNLGYNVKTNVTVQNNGKRVYKYELAA